MSRVILSIVGVIFLNACGTVPINLTEEIMQLPDQPQWEKIAEKLDFPEGPVWDGSHTLFVSSCYGHRVNQISHMSGKVKIWSQHDSMSQWSHTNGLAFGPDKRLYACEFEHGRIIRFDANGEAEIVLDGFNGTRFIRPNDITFDKWGNGYFTDSGHYRRENPDGRVYRLAAGSDRATIAADHLAFANGLAFSLNGATLYVAESARQVITQFTVSQIGELSDPETFAVMEGGDPDGMAVDTSGNLWVAHFGAGKIVVFGADGTRLGEIVTPGKKPSNLAFGGADLKCLYLTEDETNAVYRLNLPFTGAALPFVGF